MKVFIFAGQSNAGGLGKRPQLNPVAPYNQNEASGWEGHPTISSDTSVQYDRPTLENFPCLYNASNSGLDNLRDGWGHYEGSSPNGSGGETEVENYGPELAFNWKYKQAHPTEDLAIIKVTLGGSSLENDWMPSDNPMWLALETAINQAKARLAADSISYEWSGFLWMQGESGCSGTYGYVHGYAPGTEYSDYLRTFLAAVRDLTSASLPVVIGRIGNHMTADRIIDPLVTGGDNTKENLIGATNHRRDQQVLVGGDSGNCWVDTDNLPVLIDTVHPEWSYHHTSAGYLAMGERFYASYTALTEPAEPNTLGGGISISGGMSIG